MRAAAAATDKYVLDFCLPGRILRMGGMSFHMPFRGPFSRVYHDTGVVFCRFYPIPFPPSPDPSREISNNFFFFIEIRPSWWLFSDGKWKERAIKKRSGKFVWLNWYTEYIGEIRKITRIFIHTNRSCGKMYWNAWVGRRESATIHRGYASGISFLSVMKPVCIHKWKRAQYTVKSFYHAWRVLLFEHRSARISPEFNAN